MECYSTSLKLKFCLYKIRRLPILKFIAPFLISSSQTPLCTKIIVLHLPLFDCKCTAKLSHSYSTTFFVIFVSSVIESINTW